MTEQRTTLEIADRMCYILFRKDFKELTETEKHKIKWENITYLQPKKIGKIYTKK